MKSFKKIAILICVVAGIVAFWLIPGINKATDVKYTRLYEDTDVKKSPGDSVRVKIKKAPKSTLSEKNTKVYKRESISSSAKIKNIKASMFSRAMQFERVKEIDLIDSLNKSSSNDSLEVIQ
jgi:lipopolysaccharide export LptBFGC system permease protein LptF